MSTNPLAKIDKFIVIFTFVLVIMAVVVVYNFNGIFSAMTTAYEVDIVVSDSELRIDKNRLDQAHDAVFNKEIISLELR